MANNKLCLLICENYRSEAEAVIESGSFRDVKLFTYPALCNTSEAETRSLSDYLPPRTAKCGRIAFIGGQCARYFELPSEKTSSFACHNHEQCFYLFINKDIVDGYLKDGACLQTSGSLNRWRQCIREMGLDQKSARKLFKKTYSRIILLDTGMIKNIFRKLQAFSKFLALPSETVPAGLDHFRIYLNNIILEWHLEKEQSKYKERLKEIRSRKVERREHERHSLRRTCLVEMNDSEMVELKDISLGGIRLNTPHRLAPDSVHIVKIFPSIKDEINLTGKVVWAFAKETTTGSNNYETGIKFDTMGEVTARSLETFFRSISNPAKRHASIKSTRDQ